MSIAFITTNQHKYQEVRAILAPYGVEIEHINQDYNENHDATLDEIARDAAQYLATELQRPIVVEDTGLFFKAFPGFPGTLPKFVFNTLGYPGLFKLLAGEDRTATFITVAAYAKSGEEPRLFKGSMVGQITTKIYDQDIDVMPYDRIFIPDGQTQVISRLSLTTKNNLSQRGAAFRAFGKYVRNE